MSVEYDLGKIVLTKDSYAEVIFNTEFLRGEHRVCQIDFLNDVIADLTLLHNMMIEDGIDAVEGIKRITSIGSPNFVEMRGRIKRYKIHS